MSGNQDVFQRLFDLIRSSESASRARGEGETDSSQLPVTPPNQWRGHPRPNAYETLHRAEPAVGPREAISMELGRLFRSPQARLRRQEEEGNTGNPLLNHSDVTRPIRDNEQAMESQSPIPGPRFVPRNSHSNRRRSRPYSRQNRGTSGSRFHRTVVLIPEPAYDAIPRGRLRDHLYESGLEERVEFTSRMTPYETRHAILRTFQRNGHLLNITDCFAVFQFVMSSAHHRLKLVPLSDREQQTTDGALLMSRWRAQRIVYIRATTTLPSYQPSSEYPLLAQNSGRQEVNRAGHTFRQMVNLNHGTDTGNQGDSPGEDSDFELLEPAWGEGTIMMTTTAPLAATATATHRTELMAARTRTTRSMSATATTTQPMATTSTTTQPMATTSTTTQPMAATAATNIQPMVATATTTQPMSATGTTNLPQLVDASSVGGDMAMREMEDSSFIDIAVQVSEEPSQAPQWLDLEGTVQGYAQENLKKLSSQSLSGFVNEEPAVFLAWLEEVHGLVHPPIVTLPFEQIRHHANANMVPLLMYISQYECSDIHQDEFCRNIITEPRFIQAVRGMHFQCIGRGTESARVRDLLNVQNSIPPVLYIITTAANGSQRVLSQSTTELSSLDEILASIISCREHQDMAVNSRRRSEEQQRQDVEYEESLRQDRERDQQRVLDGQRAQQQEENAQTERREFEINGTARRHARASLPPEPAESATTVLLRLRDANGTHTTRRLEQTSSTEVLYNLAFALVESLQQSREFRLVADGRILPRGNMTLADCEITNATVLNVFQD